VGVNGLKPSTCVVAAPVVGVVVVAPVVGVVVATFVVDVVDVEELNPCGPPLQPARRITGMREPTPHATHRFTAMLVPSPPPVSG
jgi:hypothetical protein